MGSLSSLDTFCYSAYCVEKTAKRVDNFIQTVLWKQHNTTEKEVEYSSLQLLLLIVYAKF